MKHYGLLPIPVRPPPFIWVWYTSFDWEKGSKRYPEGDRDWLQDVLNLGILFLICITLVAGGGGNLDGAEFAQGTCPWFVECVVYKPQAEGGSIKV